MKAGQANKYDNTKTPSIMDGVLRSGMLLYLHGMRNIKLAGLKTGGLVGL